MAAILGKLFANYRAGENKIVYNLPGLASCPETIKLTSPAFEENGRSPLKHCGQGVGENISPVLTWTGVPSDAQELVIVMEDPDAPIPVPFMHMIAAGINPQLEQFNEGELNEEAGSALKLRFGRGTTAKLGYQGPKAMPGHGTHHYIFQIFALRTKLDPSVSLTRQALSETLPGQAIARGRLTCTFDRMS
jgi:Raf kinase inhibitor-like YbhB/YbcL family protein